jgi:competence protein ComEC
VGGAVRHAGASAYCLFSGSEVATQRSLIMTLVMLGAVVCGRSAISMRNLAIAALLVLSLDPNALLGPSFQMSFAAVAAMIAAFERRAGSPEANDVWGMRAQPDDPAKDLRADPFGRAVLLAIAMGVTTLVASIATDPYALYHFHRITPYGLLGNMLVLPLIEFVVMPAAVLGVIAAPFGLDGPVWWLMGQGIAFMMSVAQWVASLSGSVLLLPAFGPAALLLMTFAILWVTLWQTRVRWAGLGFAVAGVWVAWHTPQPDLLVSGQGRIAAYRNDKGVLEILNARANTFGAAQWLASDADRRKPDAPDIAGKGRCDRLGCTGQLRDGRVLALVLSRAALPEDCSRADIIVTSLQAAAYCKGPELVIDRAWLRSRGATRGFLQKDGTIRFETSRSPLADRPWSPLPAGVARAAIKHQPAKPKDDSGWVKAR